MADNREQIEQIKERLDIVNVISRYVKLRKAGRNYIGLCPFHNEKTPSFSVNPELQIFKCFGCGKGGDLFTFVQEIEKIDFPETLEKLAADAGIKLVKSPGSDRYKAVEEINDIARRFYAHHLYQPKNQNALKYLQGRGLREEDIKKFSIGFAPGENLLLQYFNKLKKYSEDQLLSSGLFVNKEGKLREKFILRIMFPILSARGKTIAFTGRILPDNKYGPKYMNSPETPIFAKKMGVYGIFESRQGIRREDLCIVTEGSVDVISAHAVGLDNIVAPLGTAFTEEQAGVISRLTKNLLFIFDSDTAGQAALERAFIISSRLGLNAYAVSPSPYKDLDEMIQKDPEDAKTLVENRVDAFSYLISSKVKGVNLSDYSNYTNVLKYAVRLISSVPDPSIRDFYAQKVKDIAGIDLHSTAQARERAADEVKAQSNNKLTPEQYYLQVVLGSSPLQIPTKHTFEDFLDSDVKEILATIEQKKPQSLKDLNELLSEELSELLVRLSSDPSAGEGENVNMVFQRILRDNAQNSLKNLRTQLAAAEQTGDAGEIEALVEKIQAETVKLKQLK
jgi:DNA primase